MYYRLMDSTHKRSAFVYSSKLNDEKRNLPSRRNEYCLTMLSTNILNEQTFEFGLDLSIKINH